MTEPNNNQPEMNPVQAIIGIACAIALIYFGFQLLFVL